MNIVAYDIVPFLTLITSSLALLFSITGKLYVFIIQWKERKAQHQDSAKATDYESLDNKENPIIDDKITTEIMEEETPK